MRTLTGLDYLEMATRLLQRARGAHPTAGLWEAADLQWWWRSPRPSDRVEQCFWVDGAGQPEAAVVFTAWRTSWACDLLVVPGLEAQRVPAAWAEARRRMDALGLERVDVMARDDDALLAELATAAGFVDSGARGGTTWMDAADRPAVPPLPPGYRLTDRAARGDRPHHMIPRATPDIAARLAQTSLYRPDLDLLVEAPGGEPAAYGIFWHDPATGVGFVEPMRTLEPHQGRGLARYVLAAGLERLAQAGSTRLRVNYEVGNAAAERLYFGAGFALESTNKIYTRTAPAGQASS